MIVSVSLGVELDLMPGWRELPPAPVLVGSEWAFEWVEESNAPAHRRAALVTTLTTVARFASAPARADRVWLLVSDPADASSVLGLASLSVQRTAEAANDAEGCAEAGIDLPHALLWGARSELTVLAGHPAEIRHEFALLERPGGPALTEHYVGTVYPHAAVAAVRLEISAGGLAAFGDVVALGDAVLNGLRFVSPAE
ncbi:MAG: hypothetical protein QM635_01995 [Microbacteriaceae bacterium]